MDGAILLGGSALKVPARHRFLTEERSALRERLAVQQLLGFGTVRDPLVYFPVGSIRATNVIDEGLMGLMSQQ